MARATTGRMEAVIAGTRRAADVLPVLAVREPKCELAGTLFRALPTVLQ